MPELVTQIYPLQVTTAAVTDNLSDILNEFIKNNIMSILNFTPESLTRSFILGEEKLILFISKQKVLRLILSIALLTIGTLIIYFNNPFLKTGEIPFLKSLMNQQESVSMGPLLGLMMLFSVFRLVIYNPQDKIKNILFFILFGFLFVAYDPSKQYFYLAKRFISEIFIIVFPFLILYFFLKKYKKNNFNYVVIGFIVSILSTELIINQFIGVGPNIIDSSKYWLFGALLLNEHLTYQKTTWPDFLFPVQLVGGLPVLQKMRSNNQDYSLITSAAIDVTKIFIILSIRPYLADATQFENNFFLQGVYKYLYVYLVSWLGVLLPVCVGKFMGYNLLSPFQLPLLAASPIDRWRRWNTYIYDWFRMLVFYPLYKNTKSVALAVFCCFFITWYMSFGPYALMQIQGLDLNYNPFEKLTFFGLQALLVYFNSEYKIKIFDGSKIIGWLGVIAMFCLMSIIHQFAF